MVKLLSNPSCKQGWGKKRERERACTVLGKSTKGGSSKAAEQRRRDAGEGSRVERGRKLNPNIRSEGRGTGI